MTPRPFLRVRSACGLLLALAVAACASPDGAGVPAVEPPSAPTPVPVPVPEPPPAVSLDFGEAHGHTYRLTSLDVDAPLAGTEITLEVADDGRFAGSGGVNRYTGRYTVRGAGRITLDGIASTRMFRDTPPGSMAQEQRYFGVLVFVDGFRIVGERLELQIDGATVLSFERR